jgi:hypothetical protein
MSQNLIFFFAFLAYLERDLFVRWECPLAMVTEPENIKI